MKDLYQYILDLYKKGELPFKVTTKESRCGNMEFTFSIGNNNYCVSWFFKVKNSEDMSIKNNKWVNYSEVFEDIKNYKVLERDYKLNKLLNAKN